MDSYNFVCFHEKSTISDEYHLMKFFSILKPEQKINNCSTMADLLGKQQIHVVDKTDLIIRFQYIR